MRKDENVDKKRLGASPKLCSDFGQLFMSKIN